MYIKFVLQFFFRALFSWTHICFLITTIISSWMWKELSWLVFTLFFILSNTSPFCCPYCTLSRSIVHTYNWANNDLPSLIYKCTSIFYNSINSLLFQVTNSFFLYPLPHIRFFIWHQISQIFKDSNLWSI